MTYTNKINKCIFYTGTTNQFIHYVLLHTVRILKVLIPYI